MSKKFFLNILLIFVLLSPAFALTQTPLKSKEKQKDSEDIVMKDDIDNIVIPVSILEKDDAWKQDKDKIIGAPEAHDPLTAKAFKVWIDKVPQQIESCKLDDEPITVVFVYDMSGSMGEAKKLSVAKRMLKAFGSIAHKDDRYAIVTFQEKIIVFPEEVGEFVKFETAINSFFGEAKGETAFFDAVEQGILKIKEDTSNYKKVLFIISDGMDNHSRKKLKELRHMAEEADVQIDSVCLYQKGDTRQVIVTPISPIGMPRVGYPRPDQQSATMETPSEEDEGRENMQELSEVSNGIFMQPVSIEELERDLQILSAQLRQIYEVTIVPSQDYRDGKKHNIKVELVKKELPKTWRDKNLALNCRTTLKVAKKLELKDEKK